MHLWTNLSWLLLHVKFKSWRILLYFQTLCGNSSTTHFNDTFKISSAILHFSNFPFECNNAATMFVSLRNGQYFFCYLTIQKIFKGWGHLLELCYILLKNLWVSKVFKRLLKNFCQRTRKMEQFHAIYRTNSYSFYSFTAYALPLFITSISGIVMSQI